MAWAHVRLRGFRIIARTALYAAAILTCLFASRVADAFPTATGEAFGLDVDVSLLLVNASIGPTPVAADYSDESFSNTGQLLSVSTTLGLGALDTGVDLSTGVMDVATNYDVLTPEVISDASVDGLSLIVEIAGIPLLTITADAITAQTVVNGSGPFGQSGSADIANLTVTGGALLPGVSATYDSTINGAAAPNTDLIDLLGVVVTLNYQAAGGNGVTNADFRTVGLRIVLTGVTTGIGSLSGIIEVSSTYGSLSVPEPGFLSAAAGLLIPGILLIRRSRRRGVRMPEPAEI